MKKVLCMLLCAVMLMGMLVSCGGEDPTPSGGDVTTTAPDGTTADPQTPGTTTNDPNGSNGTTASQPTGAKYEKHVAIDFGDSMGRPRDFTFMARNNRWKYLHGTETSTETVTMAAYQRNMLLQEMYNIEIAVVNVQEPNWSPENWHTMLASADGEYDIAIPDVWWGVEYGGYFVNLMTLKEINVDDEYWVKGWNDSMIINNRMYSIVGDAALEILENIEVVFYNRSIEEEYDYDLYQTVVDGEWTIDKMLEMTEVFEDALNNNDTTDDVYGVMMDQHSLRSAFYSAGIKMLKTNKNNGVISVIANTSRNINIADKVTELLHAPVTLNRSNKTARAVSLSEFINSQLFLYMGCLYRGTELKNANTSFEYGILLFPKYEVEDDYISTSYGLSTWCIPETTIDSNMVAVILDTMTWLSNTEDPAGMGEDRLVYTYYETVVKGQITEAPEDNEMLDWAREIAYYDFSFICNDSLLRGFESAAENDVSISSTLDGLVSTAETELTDIVAFYNY